MQIGSIASAQCPGNRHALLLAAGELAGELVGMRLEADAVEQLEALVHRFFLAALEHLDLGNRQILGNAHVREEFEMLEHHADVGTQLGEIGFRIADRGAVDDDFTGLERFEAVDALDQRRLARAGRSADNNHFTLVDRGAAILEDIEGTVILADI